MAINPKIIIIETGKLDEALGQKHGDYPQMFKNLLAEQGLDLGTCHLVSGAELPNLKDADGFLITGSRHGVYDDLPWIEPLKSFIRQCAEVKKPIIGICFGHQIIAEALGGKVVKSEKGWGLGPNSYQVTDKTQMPGAPESLTINAIHQDQVIKKPGDARVICTSDFCEYAGFVYGGLKPYAMSLQAHPEFQSEFVTDLIATRRGKVYPEHTADAALEKIDNPLDSYRCSKWFADFYRAAIATA